MGGGEPEGAAGALLHIGDGEVGLGLVGAGQGLLRPERAKQVAAQHLVDMEVGVDERGRDQPAARVDARRRVALQRGRNRLDAPLADANGDPRRIVEARRVLDEQVPVRASSRVRHVSSAVNGSLGSAPAARDSQRIYAYSAASRASLPVSARQSASGSCQPSGQAMAPSAFFRSK